MSTIKYRDDPSVWEDYLSLCREALDAGMREAHDWNHGVLRHGVIQGLRKSAQAHDFDKAERFDQLLYKSLLFGARDFFDDYLQAVEYGKPHDKKFYVPRRHYLLRYVKAYQKVLDGELDFLSISMPKSSETPSTMSMPPEKSPYCCSEYSTMPMTMTAPGVL